ncbi:MAG TPA: hypothetical protein VFH95_11260 [Candidatus Kapabacteria bacterium]|nr:hypothetical protein [Candidatus Kapabacteria bacterium]
MFIRRYRTESLIAIAAAAIAACWLPIRMRFPFDDTYITFRYAANLAHGFGIVWNAGGAHTEGYTNFFLVLLLAPFSALGWDLVAVSQAIGVIAVVVSAIAIYRIVAQTSVRESQAWSQTKVCGTFAVALFLLDPFTWFNAYSGMETSLFTMWLLLSLLAFAQHRTPLAFAFATLATLTRPEGALMGMMLIAVACGSSLPTRRSLKAVATWFVLPLLLYAGWKLWYFGNLLPNSFYIKVAQAQEATFFPGRGTIRIFYEGVWYLLPFAFIAARKRWTNRVVRIAVLWCVLLSAFYLYSQLIQNEYQRFTNSIEVLLILLIGMGLAAARTSIRSKWIWGAAFVALLALHILWPLYARGGLGYIQRTDEEQNSYPRVAEVFRSIPNHGAITLAWGDAGRLPYFSGMLSIDPVGLNTNEIAHAHSADEVIGYILRSKPDLIIIPLMLPKEDTISNDTCRRVLSYGHGRIGSAYPALARAVLATTYKPIAILPQSIYDLDLLADTTSPHYRDIVNTIVPRIGHDSNFERPATCIQ